MEKEEQTAARQTRRGQTCEAACSFCMLALSRLSDFHQLDTRKNLPAEIFRGVQRMLSINLRPAPQISTKSP